MTSIVKALGSMAAVAAILIPTVAIGGGNMTRADFDRCNQVAMQVAGVSGSQSPSASPTTSGTGASGSISSGTGSSSTAASGTATSGTGLSTSSPSGNTISSPAT